MVNCDTHSALSCLLVPLKRKDQGLVHISFLTELLRVGRSKKYSPWSNWIKKVHINFEVYFCLFVCFNRKRKK